MVGRVLVSAAYLGLTVLAGGCVKPAVGQAPGDLRRALGAAAPVRADDAERKGRTLTWDLEPFRQARLANPHTVVPAIVRALCAPDRFEAPYEIRVVGRHLLVRHEPSVLKRVRAILRYLEREKLKRIRVDVHLVEVPQAMAGELDRAATSDGRLPKGMRARIVAGLGTDAVRTLARRQLRLTNGTWQRVTDGRSRRPVTGVTVEHDRPVEVQETVEDGLALNVAAWIAATGGAVVQLEAALRTELQTGAARHVAVPFHPDPDDRSVEVSAGIDLPELRTTAVRGQARVERGSWHLIGRAPAPRADRVVLALVRADWEKRQPLRLDGLLPAGRRAITIPVALPEGRRQESQQAAQGYIWELQSGGTGLGNAWLKSEQRRQKSYQTAIINDIEINQTGGLPVLGGVPVLGGLRHRTRGLETGAWLPLLPPTLAHRLGRIERATWDEHSSLLFRWDELVCVQDERTTADLARLFRDVQTWRNRPVRVRAEWVEIPAALADRALAGTLDVASAGAQIEAGRLAAPFEVLARSGAWSEITSARNHAVLWGFMGFDRKSPEVRTLDEGGKLSVMPRRYGSGRVELDLRFVFNEIDRASLQHVAAAGGILHKPRFTQSKIEQVLAVESGKPVLLVASSAGADGGRVRALWVTARY